VLLTVRGFDPATRRFTYAINPRFGSSVAPAIGWNPVRATVDTRFEIGPDPRRRRLNIIIRGGTQRPSDARLNERELLDRLVGIAGPTAVNLPTMLPDLEWSTEQREFWRALKDTVLAHDREAFAPVARYLASLPARYDAGEVERRIRDEYEASGARYAEAVLKLGAALEARQRARLTAYLLRELDPNYVAAKRAGSWR
jgi:hypothetical protein